MNRGASVDYKSIPGETPLFPAARWGHTEIVQVSIRYSPYLRLGNSCFPQALLARGANVRVASNKGETPLQMAARYGHTEIFWVISRYLAYLRLLDDSCFLQALLVRGADVDAANEDKWTPLHLASYGGHLQISTVRHRP